MNKTIILTESELISLIEKLMIERPKNKLDKTYEKVIKRKLFEKWSEKYKKSINCNNPKGFSQRAHCQGRKKRK